MGPPSDSHVLWAARPSSLPLPTGYAARCAGCGSGVATSPRARAASRAISAWERQRATGERGRARGRKTNSFFAHDDAPRACRSPGRAPAPFDTLVY